jgi:hypothetical protein
MRFKTIGSISFQTLYNCRDLSLFAGLGLVARFKSRGRKISFKEI